MKLLWLVLINFSSWSFALSELSGDCENWPTQQDDLRNCCDIPQRWNLYSIEEVCRSACLSKEQKVDYECFMDCFLRRTDLVSKDKIEEVAVTEMYSVGYTVWADVLQAAIEKCEYESSGSLTDKLLKYFNCIDDHMEDNCATFLPSDECNSVELRFKTCHGGVKYNCASWPSELGNPESCCYAPQLVPIKKIKTCQRECKRKELFEFRRTECVENCTWYESGIMTNDGIVDYEKVKTILIENSNKSVNWEKSIENAVEGCRNMSGAPAAPSQVKQTYVSLNNYQLPLCLKENLSDKCVDFSNEIFCRKIKAYVENCPETRPYRYSYTYYGKNDK